MSDVTSELLAPLLRRPERGPRSGCTPATTATDAGPADEEVARVHAWAVPQLAANLPLERLDEAMTVALLEHGALAALAARDDLPDVTLDAIVAWAAERLVGGDVTAATALDWLTAIAGALAAAGRTTPYELEATLSDWMADDECPVPLLRVVVQLLAHAESFLPSTVLRTAAIAAASDPRFPIAARDRLVELLMQRSAEEDMEGAEAIDALYAATAAAVGNLDALDALLASDDAVASEGAARVLLGAGAVAQLHRLMELHSPGPDVTTMLVATITAIDERFPDDVEAIVRAWSMLPRVHPVGLMEMADRLPWRSASVLRTEALLRMPALAEGLPREPAIGFEAPTGFTAIEDDDERVRAFASADGRLLVQASPWSVDMHGPVTLDDLCCYAANHARRGGYTRDEVATCTLGGREAVHHACTYADGRTARAWWITAGTSTYLRVTLSHADPSAELPPIGAESILLAVTLTAPTVDAPAVASAESVAALDDAWVAGELQDAAVARDDAIMQGARWNTRLPIRVPALVEAIGYGILTADFWFEGYRVPKGLEEVIDWVAFNVQREFPGPFAYLTLREVEERYRAWLAEHPVVRAWNADPARNDGARRTFLMRRQRLTGAPMPARPFVPIDVAARNAAAWIGDTWLSRVEGYRWLGAEPMRRDDAAADE